MCLETDIFKKIKTFIKYLLNQADKQGLVIEESNMKIIQPYLDQEQFAHITLTCGGLQLDKFEDKGGNIGNIDPKTQQSKANGLTAGIAITNKEQVGNQIDI
jgi:hypothetical protein